MILRERCVYLYLHCFKLFVYYLTVVLFAYRYFITSYSLLRF